MGGTKKKTQTGGKRMMGRGGSRGGAEGQRVRERQGGGSSTWPVARMWTNARRMLRGQKEEKWLSQAEASAWLISLGEP